MSTSRMRSVADLVSRCSFPRWIDLEAQVEGRCSTEGLGRSRCRVKGTGTRSVKLFTERVKGFKAPHDSSSCFDPEVWNLGVLSEVFCCKWKQMYTICLRVEEFVKFDLQPFFWLGWFSDCVLIVSPFRDPVFFSFHLGTKARCSSVQFSATWRPHHGAFPTAARAPQFPTQTGGSLRIESLKMMGFMSY